MTFLSTISYLWDSISTFILSSHISTSNLTWNVVYFAIQVEFSKQTNTINITYHSGISHEDKPP